MTDFTSDDVSQQQQVIFWLTMVAIVLYSLILIGYIIRILKLDKIASSLQTKRPRTLTPKLVLISILIFLQILHMLLSFFDSYYWMHQFENYSLIDIYSIVTLVIQCYIIIAEWKRNTARSWIPLFQWAFMLFVDIATIITVEVLQPDASILLIIFKSLTQIVLITISVWLDQSINQKLPDQNNSLLPLMSTTFALQRNTSRIYIEFNKQFQITVKNSLATKVVFKIAVYVGTSSKIINKDQDSFAKFQQQLAVIIPEDQLIKKFGIDLSKSNSIKDSSNYTIMKYAQQKQKICQNFMIQLSQNSNYYVNPFFDFLQIEKGVREAFVEKRQRRLMKNNFLMANEQENAPCSEPFFKVQRIGDQIHVVNEQILSVVVGKTSAEIIQFHDTLLSQNILEIQLISQSPAENQLLHFIGRVANTKSLWRSFASWMCLGKKTEDKIFNMFDFWNFGFKNINIRVIGYEIGFDKEKSLHTLYLLSVCKHLSKQSQVLKPEGKTLKKRYNDFVKLDKQIKKFMMLHKIKRNSELFQLPPKFSPFGSKTSPKSRQVYFNSYIAELLSIEKISMYEFILDHCVKFLEFIQANSQISNQSIYPVDQSFNDELIPDLPNENSNYV